MATPAVEMKDADIATTFDANASNAMMDRYSRQIAALGVEVMRSLGSLRVLVVGQGGVGVETAKDLILQGPKAVVVWDNQIASVADLGTNFYLRAADVGKNPRSCVAHLLAELNPHVEVSAYTGTLDADYIGTFGAIIVTIPLPASELTRLNVIARAKNVTFIWAVTQGGFCAFFTDFGAKHTVTDLDGEPRRDFVIQSWSNDLVQITSESHDFADGDGISFSEITGPLDILNDIKGIKMKRVYTRNAEGRNVLAKNKFRVDLSAAHIADGKPFTADLATLDWANGGGTVSEVKPSKDFAFRPLNESLWKPVMEEGMTDVLHMDQGKWFEGQGTQLHIGLNALLRFEEKTGERPRLHNRADAAKVVEIAKTINEENAKAGHVSVQAVNEDIIKKMALYARAELSGFCAFLGGVAAQEVLKRFGKWTPVQQWLYFDILSIVSTNVPGDATPVGTRYDHQISMFGQALQNKIMNERWFLVGCGALGCEYIKAFALMGIGAGPKGHVYVTDMDRIEQSNLSRQFLFRSEHVGKPKSVTAASVAGLMNPALDNNVTCFEMKVCPETEDTFNPAFWDSLTGVWNALDNVQARRYTDGKCLLHSLPLLESGTQGTKANSEVILPFKTKSYSDVKDQETGGIAACTLRSFPNLILHCIEWAKPKFQETFELLPSQINSFLKSKDKFFETVEKQGSDKSKIKFLKEIDAIVSVDRTPESCIKLAQDLFIENHRDFILNLIAVLPEDSRMIDQSTGADLGPFWTGAKRFPQAAEVDKHNEEHARYLYAATNLFAFMFGLKPIDRAMFDALLAKAPAPAKWERPAFLENVQVDDNKSEEKDGGSRDAEEEAAVAAELATLQAKFTAFDTSKLSEVKVNEFEKDDDSNFHIDFITAATNMRAWNYKIKPATRLHVKTTAGKIIAALATTTAMITGVTSLEYYKLALGQQYLHKDQFYNTNVNLAAAVFNAFEPDEPIRAKVAVTEEDTVTVPYPLGFTSWDYLNIDIGDVTVRQLVEAFPSLHHGVTVSSLFKYGITDEDVKAGKGVSLYTKMADIVPTMALQMLKRDTLSAENRKRFEQQVEDAKAFNEKKRAKLDRNLLDLYRETYGELSHPSCNFIILDGVFDVPSDDNDPAKFIGPLKLKNPDEITDVKAAVPKLKVFFPPSALARPVKLPGTGSTSTSSAPEAH